MTFARRHQLAGLTPRVHAAVLLILALGLVVLALVYVQNSETNVWAGWTESRELRQPVYTERV